MKQTFSLEDKVVLITGGGGILGQRFSKGFYQSGAKVAVVDYDLDAANLACEGLDGCVPFQCDVKDPVSVKLCVERVVKHFGKIDILLNNAATKTKDVRAFFEPFEDYDLDGASRW